MSAEKRVRIDTTNYREALSIRLQAAFQPQTLYERELLRWLCANLDETNLAVLAYMAERRERTHDHV